MDSNSSTVIIDRLRRGLHGKKDKFNSLTAGNFEARMPKLKVHKHEEHKPYKDITEQEGLNKFSTQLRYGVEAKLDSKHEKKTPKKPTKPPKKQKEKPDKPPKPPKPDKDPKPSKDK